MSIVASESETEWLPLWVGIEKLPESVNVVTSLCLPRRPGRIVPAAMMAKVTESPRFSGAADEVTRLLELFRKPARVSPGSWSIQMWRLVRKAAREGLHPGAGQDAL